MEESALCSVIPEKSKVKYDLAYEKFEKWCEENKITNINEKVLLTYFEKKKSLKASTLWTMYSMLRSELVLKRDIDIKNYTSLGAFLKKQTNGYHAKKSNVLTKEDVSKFLTEADDKKYLMTKVAMIVGIAGACRKSELTFLRVEDVLDRHSHFQINIPNAKTNGYREFAVTVGNIDGLNFVDIIRKYIKLRPLSVNHHNRFFVNYKNGKCYVQPVGINTIGKLPKTIAQYLGLPNPVLFTGHCFRRSSAIFLTDSGVGLLKVKRYGGQRSIKCNM